MDRAAAIAKLKYFNPEVDKKIDWEKVHIPSLIKLDKARDISGIAYHISSNYRTPERDKQLAGFTGAHIEIPCSAFDIPYSTPHELFLILKGLFMAGFNRIGYDPTPGNLHVHCDGSLTRAQEVFWNESAKS